MLSSKQLAKEYWLAIIWYTHKMENNCKHLKPCFKVICFDIERASLYIYFLCEIPLLNGHVVALAS